MSFLYWLSKQEIEYDEDDIDIRVAWVFMTLLTIIIALFSWVGFISGIIYYYLDEEDEIFFITINNTKDKENASKNR